MQEALNCPSCGSPIAPGQKFCGVCGLNLAGMMQQKANACPTCGASISPGQQFCGVCGSKLASISQQQPQSAQSSQTTMPRGAPTMLAGTPPTTGGTPLAKPTATQPRKYRILSVAAIIFQIFGWIVLVFGILASVAMAVFAGMGGSLLPTIPGMTAIGGVAAIGMAIIGIMASLFYGLGFLAFAEICYAVIDMEKRLR